MRSPVPFVLSRQAVIVPCLLGFLACACGNPATAEDAATAGDGDGVALPSDATADSADDTGLTDATPAQDGESLADGVTADLPDAASDAVAKDIQALCLETLQNPLKFDPTPVGTASMATLTLHNCGLQGVCVTGLDLQLQSAYVGEYNLQMQGLKTLCPGVDPQKGPSVTSPCCLAPDAQVSVEVYFIPKSASTSAKTAQIWTYSNAGKYVVLLTGLATN